VLASQDGCLPRPSRGRAAPEEPGSPPPHPSSTRANRGALHSWSVRPAKKKEPGAVLALVLDGSDRGKTRWVHPPELAPAAAPAATEPAAPVPGQRAKTSLAVRRDRLDRRRKLVATTAIAAAVADSEQTPPLATVLALAFVFGTEQNLSSGTWSWDGSLSDFDKPTTPLPLWTLADELGGTAPEDLGPRLWRRVCPVLLKRTANIGTPEDILRAYDEACNLAALVGVDSAQHLLEATASLADPKSWAEEEAAIARGAVEDRPEPQGAPDADPDSAEVPGFHPSASPSEETAAA
jgi:hypothetical protein